jgi:hypothetical protein
MKFSKIENEKVVIFFYNLLKKPRSKCEIPESLIKFLLSPIFKWTKKVIFWIYLDISPAPKHEILLSCNSISKA